MSTNITIRIRTGILLIFFCPALKAQDINSPYSVYGIGDIEQRFYDRSIGMANTSVSLISTGSCQFLKNPASLSGIERSNVHLNIAFVGRSITYSGNPIDINTNKSHDFSVKTFSIGTKLNNVWATGLGLMPLSYVGYLYKSTKTIEGSNNTYDAQYEGDGGLYNLYWNNAFAIGKHFSAGVRASLIFGSINQTESFETDATASVIAIRNQDYYSKFRVEYGAIYHTHITTDWQIALGAKLINKTKMNAERTQTVTEGNTVISDNELQKAAAFYLPASYDLGLSITHANKMTIGIDYSYEAWSDLNQKGTSWSMIDSKRLSAGIQFSNQAERWGYQFEKNYVQVGVFAKESYLRIRNTPIDEIGASIGYGSYLSGRLFYGLALEFGRRGTIDNGLIKESYIQATFSLSFREFLYSKGRKYQ